MKKMIVMAMLIICGCLFANAKSGQAVEKPPIAYQTLNADEMVFQSAVDGMNLRVKITMFRRGKSPSLCASLQD